MKYSVNADRLSERTNERTNERANERTNEWMEVEDCCIILHSTLWSAGHESCSIFLHGSRFQE